MSFLFRLLSRLPLGVLHALGALLGRLAWLFSPSYRTKMRDNLRRAGLPAALAWDCAAGAGRMAGELPFVWERPPAQVLERVVCDDVSVLEQAEAAGQGLLFLTPHLGAFEVVARFYAARAPFSVLYKPPRQAWLVPLVEASRKVGQLVPVPANLTGVRALLRALRRGEAVGLLPDQVPDVGDGLWADFFGEPAWTMTLPERLARATGAMVILAVGERLAGGRGWRLHFTRFDGDPTPAALNALMEDAIRRWPAQYLWGYNRYKAPPGQSRPVGAADEA